MALEAGGVAAPGFSDADLGERGHHASRLDNRIRSDAGSQTDTRLAADDGSVPDLDGSGHVGNRAIFSSR